MLAIVPVKGRTGKTRLGGLLSPDERARLVAAILGKVLAACAGARCVTRVLVVTPDPGIAPDGVDVLVDAGIGHADAVARALVDERARDGALVVMGDCAFARAESLDRLVASAHPVALIPAHDGGMNALALRAPVPFEPAFGVPDGARATAARARAAGIDVAVVDDPALAFDVDVPADLWTLRGDADRGRAPSVLAVLEPATGDPR